MPPRIAFWTTSFEPKMEAVASEVAVLRDNFPHSVLWGISSRDRMRFSWNSGFAVPAQLQMPFRLIAGVAQHAFHINHLFGSLGDWFHLRAVTKRPTVLTLAVDTGSVCHQWLDKVDQFVVEWPAARDQLLDLGIAPSRIETIFPPVDVAQFTPSPHPRDPFTVLFVSSPDRKDWLSARGVDILLDAAWHCPEMRFRLLWRPWGDSADEVRRWIASRGSTNVEMLIGRFDDMPRQYHAGHVTVAPFRDIRRCKPAPNSVLESLACGRPVVVTPNVGICETIREAGAGRVAEPQGEALARELKHLMAHWPAYSRRARQLAVRQFSTERFVDNYRRVYEQLK